MVVSTKPFAYNVNAAPIIKPAHVMGKGLTFSPLGFNTNDGKRTISGHALTKTMLQDPAIPACSIVLKGSQYKPQAEALNIINKLNEVSEDILENKRI